MVSVIIPTYNRAHCLGEAIDSVLAQDPPADEVIVIDDGSTDATPDVLAGYGDRITVLRQANAGAGAARTAGLRQASGDWITFLDSDDLWYPGRLALLHHDLERPQARDIVMHMADVRFTGEGYDHELFDLRGWPVGDGDAERVEDPLSRAISALHLNSFAARRDAAANTQGFPTELKISQDGYFMCAISAQGPALFSRTTVAEVRRIAGDDAANVELFRTDPVRARRIVQRRFDLLLDLPLGGAAPARAQTCQREPLQAGPGRSTVPHGPSPADPDQDGAHASQPGRRLAQGPAPSPFGADGVRACHPEKRRVFRGLRERPDMSGIRP